MRYGHAKVQFQIQDTPSNGLWLRPNSAMPWLSLSSSSPSVIYHLSFTASRTCRSHQVWILASFVSSGWKLVPKQLPCRTATICGTESGASWVPANVPSISTSFASLSDGTPASTGLEGATTVSSLAASPFCSPSTWGSIFSTTGARMKTPGYGRSESSRNGRDICVAKDSTWRPKWLRLTRTSSPPMSS
jgi:hypothetical protein